MLRQQQSQAFVKADWCCPPLPLRVQSSLLLAPPLLLLVPG